MKFFHLSDLHIGLKLMNRDLGEDQIYILHQIASLAEREQPDAVVIAGDIYDRAVPSAEAVEIFDRFVSELKTAVPEAEIMMISGNHDSGPRVNVYRSVLSRQHLHMIGLPPQAPEDKIEKVTMEDEWGQIDFYLLPFVKPSVVKTIVGTDDSGNNLSYDESLRRLLAREEIDPAKRSVLVSHQFYLPGQVQASDIERMDSEARTVGDIDEVHADVLEPFDYAALGHIHKPMKVGAERFRYCGTPLACSVSEAGQQKAVLMVELQEKGETKITPLLLQPLRQVRIIRGSLQEVLQQGCEDYVTVVLTDRPEEGEPDVRDRINSAFSCLLEIRREEAAQDAYREATEQIGQTDPFALCCEFLGEMTDAEQELLRNVLNEALEVQT